MSRPDDSDEEVYLSDPSDDEESKSVEDYENADDAKGIAAYEAASRVKPAAGIDYALHDAEAERAALREGIPQPDSTGSKKTSLSPDAAPWVPPSQPAQDSSQQTSDSAEAQPVDKAENSAEVTEQPSPARAVPEPETAASKSPDLKEPSTPSLEDHKEVQSSPIDIKGMVDKIAASHDQRAPEESAKASDAAQPAEEKKPPSASTASATLGTEAAAKPEPAAESGSQENGDEVPISTRGDKADGKILEEEKKAPSAMPSLPSRRKPGSAMPSLPLRPTPRRPGAAQASARGKDEGSEEASDAAPKGQESTPSEEHQAEKPAASARAAPDVDSRSAAQEQPPANGSGNPPQQPPANGQRGPIVLQRMNNQPQEARGPEDEKVKKLREGLRELRVLLLRVGSRLNLSNHAMLEHVKYRLGLAERIRLGRGDSSEDVAEVAKQKEQDSPDEELADVTVLVIGTSGSGKTSTINSLLGHERLPVDPFEGTQHITEASGTIFGLKLRFIDTPGLQTAAESFGHNARVLKQIDNARKKYKPKLVMYCDRLDTFRRDLSDVPVLRQITDTLGSEVWYNTVLIMTHARSAGPLGPNNQPLPFDTLTQTRAAMLSRAIQAAVGDSRIAAPAGFAENSPSCPRNQDGEATLPNGQAWRRFVLMWILSMRILSDADSLLEVAPRDDGVATSQQQILQQLFRAQRGQKMPPLQYLVPNMIRHAGPKAYPEAERDVKSESEIKTIKDFDKRRQEYRKRTEYLKAKHLERLALALPANQDEVEGDPREGPSPGPPLGPTFDVDDTSHLYRTFEPKQGDSAWLTRARLEQNCLDHTDGVDSITTERSIVFRRKATDLGGVPATAHAIIQKDKNTTLVQTDAEASFYQRHNLVHTGRAQLLTLSGGDILYVSQLETQLVLPQFHRMTLGGMVSRLGEDGAPPTKGHAALGYKIEEDIDLPEIPAFNGKHGLKAGLARARVKLGNRKEMATGWNAEYQLTGGARENVQVVGSVSQMEYRGNKGRQYALSCALPITSETVAAPKIQLRDGQGNLYLRVTSHDHLNLGLSVLVPLGKALWDKFRRKDEA